MHLGIRLPLGIRPHLLRIAACLLSVAVTADNSLAQSIETGAVLGPSKRSGYREPVTRSSEDGVLEVTLKAHQGRITLDTVPTPVENALIFGYEVIRGKASDGQMAADNLYPSPTLQVSPGETLIVHLENDLEG